MNVQAGAGTTRGWWQYLAARNRTATARSEQVARIGAGLRRAGVDIALLMEVDGGSRRTAGSNQARRIAEAAELAGCCFFSCHCLGQEINQGNAVLAAGPVQSVGNHRLSGVGEPRFLSEAVVGWGGCEVHVFVAHTSLKATVRRKQLDEIRRLVAARERPVLLGGDFNSRKGAELDELSAALERIPAGPTFPSWKPRWALDHLFVSPHFAVSRARVAGELREADHLPLIVELALRP